MIKVTNASLIAACEQMLTESIAYTTLDCQAAVEEAYRRAGASGIDLPGSNAHYRECFWTGTPERAVEILGVKELPAGTETYINSNDGGEPGKYKADQRGNTSHMGIYMSGGRTFNSSEKAGGVVVSTKFNGRKQAVSGSWNMVGFKDYVDYGFSDAQLAALTGDANFHAENYNGSVSDVGTEQTASAPLYAVEDTTDFYTVKRGCKGGAVERLQTWLARDLGYGIEVDHDYGPDTEATVKVFQRDHGLTIDGIVGPKTWAALAQARYEEHKSGVSG